MTSSAGGAMDSPDHRFCAPPGYTAQLLTLHQHRANIQFRTANQIEKSPIQALTELNENATISNSARFHENTNIVSILDPSDLRQLETIIWYVNWRHPLIYLTFLASVLRNNFFS